MINFLIKIKHDGEIIDIVWIDPAYLFLSSADNLFQQLEFTQWAQLEKDIDDAAASNQVFFSNVQYKLKISQVEVYLFLIQLESYVLILGTEVQEPPCHSLDFYREIAFRFLKIMEKLDDQKTIYSDASRINYYEKIQALNNDLINMQRQLHKANAKLNQVNQTLNNRLVKDALTGLISRYQFEDEIKQAINQAPDAHGVFAFIDLDSFKKINDTYGHRAGDEYLITVANKLSLINIPNLLKIRIAGDEFGLYTHGYTLDQAYQIIDQIKSDMQDYVMVEPAQVGTYTIPIRLSIGFAIFNHHSDNIYQLIEYADFAMYQAKKQPKDFSNIFDLEQFNKIKQHHQDD